MGSQNSYPRSYSGSYSGSRNLSYLSNNPTINNRLNPNDPNVGNYCGQFY